MTHNSTRPRVACGSLGGTITMLAEASGGLVPALTADDLVAELPQLDEVATVTTATFSHVAGPAVEIAVVVRAVDWARQQVDAGAAGVVLIQGTDTLEETTYLAELLWDRDAPLVFTGAMRSPAQVSPDGQANLLAAVKLAAAPAARGLGVMLVLDDTIHSAVLVHKADTTALSAFQSYGGLALGRLSEGEVQLRDYVRRGEPLAWPEAGLPWVPIWTAYLDDDGRGLSALLAAQPSGLVIAGMGVGHATPKLADIIAGAVLQGLPVVVASRIGQGGAKYHTYGFVGSEIDLQARGAIMAGDLNAYKARLLLALLLANQADPARIAKEFAQRGRRH